MSLTEVKKAFMESTPVRYGEIIYPRINALIYRRDSNNQIVLQAELLDVRSSVGCVYIVAPEKLGEVVG